MLVSSVSSALGLLSMTCHSHTLAVGTLKLDLVSVLYLAAIQTNPWTGGQCHPQPNHLHGAAGAARAAGPATTTTAEAAAGAVRAQDVAHAVQILRGEHGALRAARSQASCADEAGGHQSYHKTRDVRAAAMARAFPYVHGAASLCPCTGASRSP